MNEAVNGPEASAGKLENSLLSIQKYVDTSNHSLLVYKRVNKILTLLILVVLGGFGTVIGLILKNNLFDPERFQSAATTALNSNIVPNVRKELEEFTSKRGKQLQAKFVGSMRDLVEDFRYRLEDRLRDISGTISGEADEILRQALERVLEDQRPTLEHLFPELKNPQRMEDFVATILLNLDEDNEMIINKLHDDYLHKLNDVKTEVDYLAGEYLTASKEDLQVELVHHALVLLDHEFANYIYETTKSDGRE